MISQYILLGNRDWNVLVYYNVLPEDYIEVIDSLQQLDCPDKDIKRAMLVLRRKNTGLTFSNTDYKMSVVCIGEASNVEQFVNTVIHEAKHVLSHVCQFYGVEEDTETAAYLIGHLVQLMYKMLLKILRSYVNMI